MKKYPIYGDIPENWKIAKIKYRATLSPKVNFEQIEKSAEVSFLPMEYIKSGYFIPNTAQLMNNNSSYSSFEDGDIVLAKVTPCFENGNIAIMESLENGVGFGSSELFVLRTQNIHSRFLFYSLQSSFFIEQGISIMTGAGGLKRISSSFLNNYKISFPSLEKQKEIGRFLDNKFEVINRLIEEKQRLIELLNEKRQAIITQAITKGLKASVQMKDSGIHWLGEIPVDWSVKRLRYLGTLQNGISKAGEFFGTGDPFVNYGDVNKHFELPDVLSGLIMSDDDEKRIFSVLRGDIFFTRTSETIEEVAFASTCLNDVQNATFSGFLIRFRPYSHIKLLPEYAKYYFRSSIHRNYFVKEMNLVTRASLSQELLKNLPVIIPNIDEQKSIARYLDNIICSTDNIISEIRAQLEKLREYRQSIINEAVTGKVVV